MMASQMDKTFSNTYLLLLGKTGHGKSATGNSILGRKVFESSPSMDSVTNKVDFEVTKMDKRVIWVVDVPGVCDTGEIRDAELTNMLEYAIASHPKGYHALLLVYKYGNRYTKEEQETVAFLKEKLGNDFIKNHAVIVITNGDTLEKEGISKETYCSSQSGLFGQLCEECSNRVVIFDNLSKDMNKLQSQRKALFDIIDTELQGKRYDHEIFRLAQNIEEAVLRESDKPMVTEEMLQRCSLILQDVEDIASNPEQERCDENLTQLLNEATDLKTMAIKKDRKTGEIHEFIELTKLIKSFIKEEKKEKKSDHKKSILLKPRKSSIGQLVANIQLTGFQDTRQNDMKKSFKNIKRKYQQNVTEKVFLKLHGNI